MRTVRRLRARRSRWPADGRIAVVTFEDVTELESSRRRASLLADELRVMLDGVADAITVQSPDHQLIYANEAASRSTGSRAGTRSRTSRPTSTCSASSCSTSTGAPLDLARLPGRLALAGLDPEPVTMRARDRDDRRGALGADQVDRGPRPGRRRAARDQPDRGHHRAQALRGGAAVPGRGVAGGWPARSTTSGRWRRSPSWPCRRSPTTARSCLADRDFERAAGRARRDADRARRGSSRTG